MLKLVHTYALKYNKNTFKASLTDFYLSSSDIYLT